MAFVYIDPTVTEGQSFRLAYDNLSNSSTRITINVQGGTAQSGTDYENPASSFILGGNNNFARSYATYKDGIFEGTETAIITEIGSGPDSTDGYYTINIRDSDKPEFKVELKNTLESAPAGTVVGSITPTNIKVNNVVFTALTPGFAIKNNTIVTTAPLDFEKSSAPNVVVRANHAPSGISNNVTTKLSVENIKSEFTVKALTEAVLEGDEGTSTPISFEVLRSGDLQGNQSVSYSVSGVGPNDIGQSALGGTINFASGETRKTVSLAVVGDNVVEVDKTATFTISATDGDSIIKNATASAGIADDDTPTTLEEFAEKNRDVFEQVGKGFVDVVDLAASNSAAILNRADAIADLLESGVPSYVNTQNLELVEQRLRNFNSSFEKIDKSISNYLQLGESADNIFAVGTKWGSTILKPVLPALEGLNAAQKALDSGATNSNSQLAGLRAFSVAVLSGEIGTVAGGVVMGATVAAGAPIAAIAAGFAVSIGVGYLAGEVLNGALNAIAPLSNGGRLGGAELSELGALRQDSAALTGEMPLVFTADQIGKKVVSSWTFDPVTNHFEWTNAGSREKFDAAVAFFGFEKEVFGKGIDLNLSVKQSGAAFDYLTGGLGNDKLDGASGNDIIDGGQGNNRISGHGGNDTLVGGSGNDILDGGDGADVLFSGGGADQFIGGAGYDIAVFGEAGRRGYVLQSTAATGLTTPSPSKATAVLDGVEVATFLDGRVVFDMSDPAAQVVRLYEAALDRLPDQGGLNFYIERLQNGAGSLLELSGNFLASPEFRSRFGEGLSDAAYVERLYANVLGRAGEAEGIKFYLDALANGTARAQVLVNFAESPENKTGTAALIGQGIWDLNETAAQIGRLYDTALGRLPDREGLAYHLETIESGRASLGNLADNFMASPEFVSTYGSLTNREFVERVYLNTLDRNGEEAGIDFYVTNLDSGKFMRRDVVTGFSESPEHQALTASNIQSENPEQFGILFSG